MIKDFITQTANSIYAQIGLILFVLLFAGILIWTYSGKKDRFKHASRLPLDDDTTKNHSSDTENH